MKNLFTFLALIFLTLIVVNIQAQNIFPSTGRAGIYTTSPAASLQVKGGARIGTTANYVNIDSATGNLSFVGTSAYRVAGNKYAFQYAGNANYGLFFNSTNVQYEFRNGSAVPVFSVNANNGNSVFNGTLKVGAYTLPATDGTNGQLLKTNGAGVLTWSADNGGSSGANTSLSNLSAPTAVNVDLLPNLNGGHDIGSAGLSWKNIYMGGEIYMSGFRTVRSDGNNIYAGLLAGQAEIAGSGVNNTGIGNQALYSSVFGKDNAASGALSLYSTTSGNRNTANGSQSLYSNTNGNDNTANGYKALFLNNTGYSNVAVGINALYSNTTRSNLVAIGDSALFNNGNGAVTSFDATFNTAVGSKALYSNNTGYNATANGYKALYSNTTGFNNTATGSLSLYSNITGDRNTANGTAALYTNTTGEFNTANGDEALYYNTTGSYNTANGFIALLYNTTGSNNTANGAAALYYNTSGYYNTANGASALYFNTTGNYNTANGYDALSSNTTGSTNTANGSYALNSNTTGVDNTANGNAALYFNTTGYSNTANGVYALYRNTNGNNNTGMGYNALYNNGTGAVQSPDGINNTGIGSQALYSNTIGYNNAAFGFQALYTNVTGINNTAIGLDADVNAGGLLNATAIGVASLSTASNQVRIGSIGGIYGTDPTSIGGKVGWSTLSDGRVKKNIKENVPGLAFINKLKPITYNIDDDAVNKIVQRRAIKDKDGKEIKPSSNENNASNAVEKIVHTGFIAQDVEKAAKSLNYDFSGVDAAKNNKDLYGLRYSDFVVPLVKAVQELSKMNDAKDARIDTLQNQLNDLKALVLSIQQKQESCSPCSAAVSEQSQSYSATLSDASSLQQNIPNPFNHTTTINYTLPQKFTSAQIMITDKMGRTLKAVNVSGIGNGSLNVDAATLASGAYNYSLIVDGKLIATKQMILAR